MKHSIQKHKALYGLLKSKGFYEYRHSIIEGFTDGRTNDSRGLSELEITELIKQLRQAPDSQETKVKYAGRNPMIGKIYLLCRQYGYTMVENNKVIVDRKRLDQWMKKYSYLKKPFGEYSLKELPKLVTQFETVVLKFAKNL